MQVLLIISDVEPLIGSHDFVDVPETHDVMIVGYAAIYQSPDMSGPEQVLGYFYEAACATRSKARLIAFSCPEKKSLN